MSSVNNNPLYSETGIYNTRIRDREEKNELFNELFNDNVNTFLIPLHNEHIRKNLNEYPIIVSPHRSYYPNSSFVVDNSVNIWSENAIKAQQQYTKRATGFAAGSIVTIVATYLAVELYHRYQALLTETTKTLDFKCSLAPFPGHAHYDMLKKVTNERLNEIELAKQYVLAKSAVVISSFVSGLFLAIAALSAPELMAAGAIFTGLSLLGGIAVWSAEHFDESPKIVANTVRNLLKDLKRAKQPIELNVQRAQNNFVPFSNREPQRDSFLHVHKHDPRSLYA